MDQSRTLKTVRVCRILVTHAVCRQSGMLEVGCGGNCTEKGRNSAVRCVVAITWTEWLRWPV